MRMFTRILTTGLVILSAVQAYSDTWYTWYDGWCYSWSYVIKGDEAELCSGVYERSAIIPEPGPSLSSIPATLGGKAVTSIGDYAFYERTGIIYMRIPDSVTNIGNWAFSGCRGLTSVTIPNGVTNIGNYAFSGCKSLTSVTIPASVTSIGDGAFSGCKSLTSVMIPNGVTNIGNYAFSGCESLTSVTISDSVTSIGDNVFRNCYDLSEVGFPDGVTSIGDYAFYCCWNLTNTIPDSVTNIGNYAFYCCSFMKGSLPANLTVIGDYAFQYCDYYICGDVTIPSGVTFIGHYAFNGCSFIDRVKIPDSVIAIHDNAFSDCHNLQKAWLPIKFKDTLPQNVFEGSFSEVQIFYVDGNAPSVNGDDWAVVTGDAENGYTIKPSDDKKEVVVSIPDGVAAEKVKVEVSPNVETISAGGTSINIEVIGRDGNNITEYLNVPTADAYGVVDMTKARIRADIAAEVLDPAKGAKVSLVDTHAPSIETANTRPGLKYTFAEGRTIESLTPTAHYKWGDGTPFKPTPSITGGKSGFYTIMIEK